MKRIIRLLLSAFLVIVLAQFLPSVGIDNYITAVIVALVLSLLNFIVRPILVIFTLPVTILTFGLFLLFINASIILLADYLVDGFYVSSIWSAIIFSLLLSISQSILFTFLKEDK